MFGGSQGLTDMLVQALPSSRRGTARKVAQYYTGGCQQQWLAVLQL